MSSDEIKKAEWRGYLLKTLEVVEEEINKLSDEQEENKKKIQDLLIRDEKTKIYRKIVIGITVLFVSAIMGGIITAILMLVL